MNFTQKTLIVAILTTFAALGCAKKEVQIFEGPAGNGGSSNGAVYRTAGHLTTCVPVSGASGLYAKKDGENAKFYGNSTCSDDMFKLNAKQGEVRWLSDMAYVTATDDGSGIVVRVVSFN